MKIQNMVHQIIFKTIVGSQAYGTATASSDIDYKGVYVQHPKEILAFRSVRSKQRRVLLRSTEILILKQKRF
jgi:predicted nucleotidyltransferase